MFFHRRLMLFVCVRASLSLSCSPCVVFSSFSSTVATCSVSVHRLRLVAPPRLVHTNDRAPRIRRLCFTTHTPRAFHYLRAPLARRSTHPQRSHPLPVCTGDEESCAVEDEDDDAHGEMVPFRPGRGREGKGGRIRASAGFVSVSFFSFLFRFGVVFLPLLEPSLLVPTAEMYDFHRIIPPPDRVEEREEAHDGRTVVVVVD